MGSAKKDTKEQQIADLRKSLLSLKPAGAEGFEGLLRIILYQLSGVPFRLAASGLQGGLDGDAAFKGDHICFEAKRYDEQPHRNEVLTKIVDLDRSNSFPLDSGRYNRNKSSTLK